MKRWLVFMLLQSIALAGLAHEFWMQTKFFYSKGNVAGIDFMVGENFEGERWPVKPGRIIKLEKHTAAGVQKLTIPTDTASRPALTVPLTSEGEILIVMQTNNAVIESTAEQFNAYLKEDGLDEVMNIRTSTGTLDRPAREHYQRNAKLLVSCGGVHDNTYRKNSGMPLEIIALQNPYTTPVGGEIQFRVLFENKPHAFALVKIWHKDQGRTFMQNVYTDKDGVATTIISGKGSWMVSCVKMKASTETNIDWQSYWGSFVFGIQ